MAVVYELCKRTLTEQYRMHHFSEQPIPRQAPSQLHRDMGYLLCMRPMDDSEFGVSVQSGHVDLTRVTKKVDY